ncbi:MAG TPA: tetratricopeptide repeat protein [Candidatus Gastranaerophilales bacterium]|nr:tetratricopeptide repeat protein [Candidatus Gastranaerophilales bacterium]
MNKKLVITLCASSLLCFSTIKAGAESINIEKLNFDLGVKSLNENQLNEAVKYFNLVLTKDPNNVEAHYNIAVAHKKLGNHAKSLYHFDKVVELLNSPKIDVPDVINISNSQAKKQYTEDNQQESLNRFDVYTEVKSKENDYIDLGDMHADSSQYKEAMEYYNLALKVNPYNDNTYFKICKCHLELGNYLNAEPYIKRAIELDPNNSQYDYYKNKISQKLDSEYGSSIRKREELVFKNLNDKDPLEEFERKHYNKKLFEDEWAGENKQASSIDKTNYEQKQKKDADQKTKITDYYGDSSKRKVLEELSKQEYNDFSYKQSQELDYLDLGDLHFDNQEHETAVEYYKMALSINPNNDYTYYKLSRCYLEAKDFKKADEYIQKALNLSDKNREYVYFKNQITDKLAKKLPSEKEEFYSPRVEDPNKFYVDEIAQEPTEFTPVEKTSAINKMKTAISSIKKPEIPEITFKMPKISKLPEKIMNPLEGKVEKFSERRKEKQEKIAGKTSETVFNKPHEYYEIKETASESEYKQAEMTATNFQEPISPVEQEKELYSANYYNEKGIEFFKRDNLEKAEGFFKKAVELKPMYARGYNNLANVEFKRENYLKATEYALKAVEVDPEFAEGYYNLALISKKQKNFDNEILYLNKTITVDPKYYEAYFARGLAYYKAGNYDKAKYNFSEVLKFRNDHYLASQNLGIIYANELNYDQAEKYLNLAVKLNRENPQTYFHLGIIRQNSGDILSAIEDFQKTIELDSSNYKAYLALSKCYEQNNQPEKAIQTLRMAAENNPENAEIYNYLGLLSLSFDKYEEACLAFKKAVEKNSKRAIYHYNLSQCYLCMGKRKESNVTFQRAVSVIPVSVQDYTDLAQIFYDRGMASYSIQVLKQGITNLPQNDYLFLVLSDFYEKTGAVKAAKDILTEYLTTKSNQGTFSLLVKKRLDGLEN